MYFSDLFNVPPEILADSNVFDISLVSDLPLFIDPFLIFDSDKPEYQQLHDDIVRYLSYVRDKVLAGTITASQEREWLHFPEIPNNWLGYSVGSNAGRGLGNTFASGATIGLKGPVSDFGNEHFSKGSHIERLFLFSEGTGKDALSDFITNLCHDFLLKFTQAFAEQHLAAAKCKQFDVRRVTFDYHKERWINHKFTLPVFNSQHVLLTPVDLLTQSVPWINRPELFERFGGMLKGMSDTQLRDNVNTFLNQKLAPPPSYPKDKEYRPSKKDVHSAYAKALEMYPDCANWYVAIKEDCGDEASDQSRKRVLRAKELYRDRILSFLSSTLNPLKFFSINPEDRAELLSVFAEALRANGRALFLGDDGLLNELSGDDVKLMCTLAWRADGNQQRSIPQFRFIYDSKSASQFESGLHSGPNKAGMLVITTDNGKKARVELAIRSRDLDRTEIASLAEKRKTDTSMKSVFISYTEADDPWARWIGGVLMSAGYVVTVQYKDFLPGTNFVEQMDLAVKNADLTVAVLSANYLNSDYAAAEWQAVFREDPLGHHRKLVPVRVAKVNVKGLLGSIVYADIVGLTEESARAVLLGAISADHRPNFTTDAPAFPGQSIGPDRYETFLERVPSTIEKSEANSNQTKRLELATTVAALPTNQVNMLVYALNPPDNEIPPVSAPAKDRAAALLDWSSREGVDLSVVDELVNKLRSC